MRTHVVDRVFLTSREKPEWRMITRKEADLELSDVHPDRGCADCYYSNAWELKSWWCIVLDIPFATDIDEGIKIADNTGSKIPKARTF